jgi:hypothetical protein
MLCNLNVNILMNEDEEEGDARQNVEDFDIL